MLKPKNAKIKKIISHVVKPTFAKPLKNPEELSLEETEPVLKILAELPLEAEELTNGVEFLVCKIASDILFGLFIIIKINILIFIINSRVHLNVNKYKN